MFIVMLFGWAQTRRSAGLLLRGEGDVLLDRIHQPLREAGEPPSNALLQRVLDGIDPPGVHFIGFIDAHGQVIASAGAAPEGLSDATMLRPGDPLRRGGLAWVRSRPLPGPPPADAPGPPGRGGPSLLIAFEPRLVLELDRASWATLVAGGLGALGLFALSLFARRMLAGRDDALNRLAHERRLASLGTMSGVVAHELRNPLASLKGHAQLLVESLESPQHKAQAQHVVDAAWRLERLSTSLLELARTGAIAREDVSPVDVVRGAIASFEANRVQLDVSAAPAQWSLDPLRFAQVVTNLVDNGMQASGSGAGVEVRVAHEGLGLVVEVRDHGPGVPLAEQDRIFEPFVTTRVKGVGLGLAIARQIVGLHEGTLVVRDAPGGGACFRVEVPPSP
jgi:two-component system sensor histidine kinase HydH